MFCQNVEYNLCVVQKNTQINVNAFQVTMWTLWDEKTLDHYRSIYKPVIDSDGKELVNGLGLALKQNEASLKELPEWFILELRSLINSCFGDMDFCLTFAYDGYFAEKERLFCHHKYRWFWTQEATRPKHIPSKEFIPTLEMHHPVLPADSEWKLYLEFSKEIAENLGYGGDKVSQVIELSHLPLSGRPYLGMIPLVRSTIERRAAVMEQEMIAQNTAKVAAWHQEQKREQERKGLISKGKSLISRFSDEEKAALKEALRSGSLT